MRLESQPQLLWWADWLKSARRWSSIRATHLSMRCTCMDNVLILGTVYTVALETWVLQLKKALSGLFGSWFLQLISWLMLFCCISERKILYHGWVALQSVTQHCCWGFDRTIQGQCHKQKCSSHSDRLGFRVKGRWNAMDSWIRQNLQCKHTIPNFDVIHDHKRWFSWEPCPMCFNKEMLQV